MKKFDEIGWEKFSEPFKYNPNTAFIKENIKMRKHPVGTINLEIVGFYPFHHSEDSKGFVIEWNSDIGFGQYTIYKTPDGFAADSECMDSNEDKDFIKELMRLFIEDLKIDY